MIIRKLVLHNFGVYAGTNEFEMKSDKPVVLVGGMNGHGKTTFLESILIALYGSSSSSYTESRYKTYGQYLRSYINTSDGTLSTSIDLEFTMDAGDLSTYRIHREWNGMKSRVSERIVAYQDGEKSQFLTDNWSMFIENILPSGLSNFFFFDGEKIAELAVENTSDSMKESIKILLGISVLDTLDADLTRIENRVSNSTKDAVGLEEIMKLRVARDAAADELSTIDERIATAETDLVKLERDLERNQQKYVTKGGDVVSKQQELLQERSVASIRADTIREQLIDDAGSELPLTLVRGMLSSILERAEKEQEQRMMRTTLSKLRKILPEYEDSGDDWRAVADFLTFVGRRFKDLPEEEVFSLSDNSIFALRNLLDGRLLQVANSIRGKQDEYKDLTERIGKLDSYLSVDIDEKAIAKIYRKIKELEHSIIDTEVAIKNFTEERRIANGKVISATADFNRKVETYLRELELNDDNERILKYVNLAKKITASYRIKLQKSKVDYVASTMTDCYKRLASKVSLIDRIVMDSVTLDLQYLNSENEEINKASLSAGEKQLMVISLLWALGICSKKKLPVIIDTPLSRLDSIHRSALIQNYFPKASDQTIILSTDSEIDGYYYAMMKDNVGDVFTLRYDDDNKATTVERGYFGEDQYDYSPN